MAIYIFIFLVAVGWYIARPDKSNSVVGLAIMMTFLCLFVGFSDMLGGYDRYIYGELFDELADFNRKGQRIADAQIFFQYPRELGYDYWNYLVSFVTSNRYIFILLTTIVIYVLIFSSIKEYIDNYPFAVILFLALIFFFTFTYLRQMMGAATAWLSVRYIIKRDLKRYLLVILIAYSFHNSALIFFPAYWIPIKKFEKNKVLLVMAVLLILGMSGLPSMLFSAYGEAAEMEERAAAYAEDTSGFRMAYLLESLFFLLFIFLNYDKFKDDARTTVLLNLGLVFCGILLFFIKSENGGRLGWYYMIGVISTMSYICTKERIINKKGIGMIVLSFFLYVRILSSWGIQLVPYKTFFTPGVRKGDVVYQMFEYDNMYAKDKFYRR